MLDVQRFGDDGTSTSGSERAGDRHNQINEKKSPVAHNRDSLPSAQTFAGLGFCSNLSYELRIRHQHVEWRNTDATSRSECEADGAE